MRLFWTQTGWHGADQYLQTINYPWLKVTIPHWHKLRNKCQQHCKRHSTLNIITTSLLSFSFYWQSKCIWVVRWDKIKESIDKWEKIRVIPISIHKLLSFFLQSMNIHCFNLYCGCYQKYSMQFYHRPTIHGDLLLL